MRILLAVDGSAHSDAAVDEIVRQHFPAGSEVRIISAVGTPYFSGTFAGENVSPSLYAEIDEAERARAHAAVDKAAAQLQANEHIRHVNVATNVIFGAPKLVILEEAEAFGADLIVVGSHGQGMFERFLLGSVSQAVALHARCSVEIVRKGITKTQAKSTAQ